MIEGFFDHQSVGHRGMSRGRPRDRTCARGPATSPMKTRHVSCCVLTGNTSLAVEPTRLTRTDAIDPLADAARVRRVFPFG